MITVSEALKALFDLTRPLESEQVPLIHANGRVLRDRQTASRDQPPFPASAMDGYAVAKADIGDTFTVIGEAAAGHAFDGSVGHGQAVRIFTGAPVPPGTGRIVIQEDTTRVEDVITITDGLDQGPHIRPAGNDFRIGAAIEAPRVLRPNDIALLAAMNIPAVHVTRRPTVAVISTGDELVMPGETPGPDQIIASNTFGLHAVLCDLGAAPRLLPLARDNKASLETAFELASGADLILTIGGASVGDHDLVDQVTTGLGMERSFYKVAMRPGKPLMAGRLNGSMVIGLPGNPVSAMVCGHIFVAPVIRAMLGLPPAAPAEQELPLANDVPANGPRQHYMRGLVQDGKITVFDRQDSSLLSVLGAANALVVRPAKAPAACTGDIARYIPI